MQENSTKSEKIYYFLAIITYGYFFYEMMYLIQTLDPIQMKIYTRTIEGGFYGFLWGIELVIYLAIMIYSTIFALLISILKRFNLKKIAMIILIIFYLGAGYAFYYYTPLEVLKSKVITSYIIFTSYTFFRVCLAQIFQGKALFKFLVEKSSLIGFFIPFLILLMPLMIAFPYKAEYFLLVWPLYCFLYYLTRFSRYYDKFISYIKEKQKAQYLKANQNN